MSRRLDPSILQQVHEELDRMKAQGKRVTAGAYDVAGHLGHLVQDGAPPRAIAETARSLTRQG